MEGKKKMEGTPTRLDILPVARKEVKDAVIQILMKQWPLNARNIFTEVKKNYQNTITYQGVHKALRQLKDQKILIEDKRVYELNPEWIVNLRRFTADVEHSRKKRLPNVLDLPKYGSATIENYGILADPYFWMLDQTHKIWDASGKKMTGVNLQRRTWPLVVISEEHYSKFSDIASGGDFLVIVKKNQYADKLFIKLWENLGFRCKIGIEWINEGEVVAANDFVFQIFQPKKTQTQWDKIYSEFVEKSIPDLSLGQKIGFKIITPSTFVVTRNPEFAQQIRSQAKACFEDSK